MEATSYNLNAVLKTNGFYFNGEYFGREDEPQAAGLATEDSDGWQLEGSWTTAPASTQYSFVAGVSQITLDGPGTNTSLTVTGLGSVPGDVLEFSVGVNMYYHAHAMKTEIAYVYQDVSPDATGDFSNNLFIVQLSLLF